MTTFRPPNMLKMFRNLRIRRFWTNPTFWLTKSWLMNPLFWLTKLGWRIRRFWLTNPTFWLTNAWLTNPCFWLTNLGWRIRRFWLTNPTFWLTNSWLTNPCFWLTNLGWRTLVDESAVFGWRIQLFWLTNLLVDESDFLVDEPWLTKPPFLVVEPWLSKRWLTNPLFWLTNPTSTVYTGRCISQKNVLVPLYVEKKISNNFPHSLKSLFWKGFQRWPLLGASRFLRSYW